MPQPVSHAEHANPIAPDAATWAAMSPRAREEFLDAVNAFHGVRRARGANVARARVDAAEHARDAALSALRGVVLTILTARGLEVPAHVRNILEAESDPAALARLATQAAVVDEADALFD
jgi:hypothetical protein